MRRFPFVLLLLISAPAFAANFATCLLDKMPGVANQQKIPPKRAVIS